MDGEFYQPTLLTDSTTLRVQTAQVRGAGDAGDNANAEPFDGCEVLHPVGFYTHPALTDTTEAFGVRRGDELLALVVIDKGQSAVNAEVGETRIQGCGASNQTTVIRIRANGNIEITAGSNVVINGGSGHVARAGDAVSATTGAGSMSAWITSVTTALNGLLGPGTITAPLSFGNVADYPTAGSPSVLVP